MIVGLMDKILERKQTLDINDQTVEYDEMRSFCIVPKKVVDITKLPAKLQQIKPVQKVGVLEGWYDLPEQKITAEIKHDLLALRSRSALNPKRHFKKESKEFPKNFHMGVIVEPKAEYFSHRLTKKHRKTNLFDEMLKDPEAQIYLKRKCSEIHERNQRNTTFKKNKNKNKSK